MHPGKIEVGMRLAVLNVHPTLVELIIPENKNKRDNLNVMEYDDGPERTMPATRREVPKEMLVSFIGIPVTVKVIQLPFVIVDIIGSPVVLDTREVDFMEVNEEYANAIASGSMSSPQQNHSFKEELRNKLREKKAEKKK